MNVVCWNVAGLRGAFKKRSLEWLRDGGFETVCIQETKCTEEEAMVSMPDWCKTMYPTMFWNSCTGEWQQEGFQRKGLSGVSIWSKHAGRKLPSGAFDKEGRTLAIEFSSYILITVYTPNSQNSTSNRFQYRVSSWDTEFRNWIFELKQVSKKPIILCGDFNVAHLNIDVYKPEKFENKSAGFMDHERSNFTKLLKEQNLIDMYRYFQPDQCGAFTFWEQKIPILRKYNKGWRIDYFLVSKSLLPNMIECNHLPQITGSDHCPIYLKFNKPKRKILKITN